jgi:hypothetical protein
MIMAGIHIYHARYGSRSSFARASLGRFRAVANAAVQETGTALAAAVATDTTGAANSVRKTEIASITPAVPHGLSHSFRRRAKTVAVVVGFAMPVKVVLEVPLAFFVYTAARTESRPRPDPARKLP